MTRSARLSDLPPELRRALKERKREAVHAERTAYCDYLERAGLPRPKPEHRFAQPRKWQIDYAFVEAQVALEIEGGVWTGGRHTRGSGFVRDMEKYNALAVRGWRLIRITPEDMYAPGTLRMLREALSGA